MIRQHLENRLWDAYEDWLLNRVGFRRRRFMRLMYRLNTHPFRWSIPLDENRAADGIYMRDSFGLEIGDSELHFNRPCTVLEMLVALAIRIESEYIGDPHEEHPERIFWEMIENLFDIDRYADYCSGDHINEFFVDNVIERWLDRDFREDGYGSIFPLKNPSRDQRKIEIWSQMNEYLSEKYPF